MTLKFFKPVLLSSVMFVGAATNMSFANEQPTRAQFLMGDIAPKLAQLTDDVLYADIWERKELSPRDRSLVTISALVAMNRPDQLRSHIRIGLKNGLTQEQIMEAITHLAFYSGWPTSVTAVPVAREVFNELKPE
ncbi:carboxymuconolactone decarboxylase family protein [Vibrio diazotrophicus]|uniref:carboxymuconolactone decarboxylase family protein n=1 Tax=Vibrio diazotrophicus TaxID=685 RepID=UPI000ABA04C2|nr:carboxymuconolactone decarboxylase family protein [Vibrio diazotrophicus]